MSAKPAAPAETVALYEAMVAGVPQAERKGAAMPYTSVNGNMFSFLDKHGVVAIRLGTEDRDAFIRKFGPSDYVHETGTVLKEYATVPAALLAKTKAATEWLQTSFDYTKSLKLKPTIRKKAA